MTSVNSPKASSRFTRFSKAECVLVLITMVWGGTFLLVQHAMTVSGPMFFVGLRFAAAASIVALFSWRHLRDLTLFELKAGSFIGVAIMLGYGLQTVGLQSIPSTSHCSNGTNGTYSAVMNADWLLGMLCSPTVCKP